MGAQRSSLLQAAKVVSALLAMSAAVAEEDVVLWRPGEDKYSALAATVEHRGSCQPECTARRVLHIPPDIPYRIKLEVVQIDMQSRDEYVEIYLGSLPFTCRATPAPTSDFNCSLAFCREVELGPTPDGRLTVQARGLKSRDACKCTLSQSGLVDCYSALLSGPDETYGLVLRLHLVPLVHFTWKAYPWDGCDKYQCVDTSVVSRRSVRCEATASEPLALPLPAARHCLEPEPLLVRACVDAPECTPPPPCSGCFSLGADNKVWRWHARGQWPTPGASVGLGGDAQVLWVHWIPGLADAGAASLALCSGELYIAASRLDPVAVGQELDPESGPRLELGEDDGSDGFATRATFVLRRVSTEEYALDSLAGGGTVTAVGDSLQFRQLQERVASAVSWTSWAFAARTHEGTTCLPGQSLPKAPIACKFNYGWCCAEQGCRVNVGSAERCAAASCSGLALLEQGTCKKAGCEPISNSTDCERAASDLGLADGSTARLVLASRYASFCTWAPAHGDTFAELWFNARATDAPASKEVQQLCRCQQPLEPQWAVGAWGECSLECGSQRRERSVVCQTSTAWAGARAQAASPQACLEAGLPEPPRSQPCATEACFGVQRDTSCNGEGRPLAEADAVALGRTLSSGNCVELQGSDAAAACRRDCLRLGNCMGFTFHAAPLSANSSHQCCFLQQLVRWEANVGRAACHFLQGVRSLSGCHCQVGWRRRSARSDSQRPLCGAAHGCCTTPAGGAMPWCPTTSPGCGMPLRGQQRWDLCDPPGMAVVGSATCRQHEHSSGQPCSSVRSLVHCNQLATSLGLPDTIPSLTLSQEMPQGCIWQKLTSKLWLNRHPAPAPPNASHSLLQLCDCAVRGFHWEADDWGPCLQSEDSSGQCKRYSRARLVWCVRNGFRGEPGGGDVVSDGLCYLHPKPPVLEPCSGCLQEVLGATATFQQQVTVPLNSPRERQQFRELARKELARAAGAAPADLRVNMAADCCSGPALQLELLLAGPHPGDRLEQLAGITRSQHQRAVFNWAASFRQPALSLSVELLRTYSWQLGGDWGPCTPQCGNSMQARSVQCVSLDLRSSTQLLVPERLCDSASRPQHQRNCSARPCRPCSSLRLGPQYSVSQGGHDVAHGSEVHMACASGYGTVDESPIVKSRCDDGSWTPMGYSCGRSCPPFEPSSQKYEVRGSDLQHGALRHVACREAEGDRAPPSATSLCYDGDWTPLALRCAGDCLELELGAGYTVSSDDNRTGRVGGHALSGATRTVACAPGFSAHGQVGEALLRCSSGAWEGHEGLPECQADCPLYELAQGYKLQAITLPGVRPAEADPMPGPETNLDTALPHGTALSVQCRNVQLESAVETVWCVEGQWEALSLICEQDCPPVNISKDKYQHYAFVDKKVAAVAAVEDHEGMAHGFSHGSVVAVGCRDAHGVASDGPLGELRCEDGEWSRPDLRCFANCPNFVLRPEYAFLMPEPRGDNASFVHGTRTFATCAEGFSPSGGAGQELQLLLPAGENGSASTPVPFGHTTCVDGSWTDLGLRCLPDCPFLELGPELAVAGPGSRKFNVTWAVSCALMHSETVQLRCSADGNWHLAEAQALDLNKPFPLDCRLPKPTLWAKLSDDEKAFVLLLVFVMLVSLCVLSYRLFHDWAILRTWFDDPDKFRNPISTCHRARRRTQGVTVQRNSVPTARQTLPLGSVVPLQGLARVRNRLAARARPAAAPGPPALPCRQCRQRRASVVCFPCGDLCMCIVCAEEVTLRFTAGQTGLRCPSCHCVITSVVDAKPAGPFMDTEGSAWRPTATGGQLLPELNRWLQSGASALARQSRTVGQFLGVRQVG